MLLAGDIGGTKTDLALFSIETGPRVQIEQAEFRSGSYPSLESIVRDFISGRNLNITHACFDVAGPVVNGNAKITNLPWEMNETSLRQEFGFQSVRLINDLHALALSVPILKPEDLITLRAGNPVVDGAIGVIAPGTGLGEAFLSWDGTQYVAQPSEGGHADFAPTNDLQIGLLQYLMKTYGHVSVERVCSGIGIPNIYNYLRDSGYAKPAPELARTIATAQDPTPVIIGAALDAQSPCELCSKTLDMFVSILGAEAGNLFVKVLATGGIYLGGGVPLHVLKALQDSRFTDAFNSKGRFSNMMERVPLHVINTKAPIIGAARLGLEMLEAGSS